MKLLLLFLHIWREHGWHAQPITVRWPWGRGRVSRHFPCSATWWADCEPGGNPGESLVFSSWRHVHYFPTTLSCCKACSVPGLSNSDNCGVTLEILSMWKPQIINIKWHCIRLFHRIAAESTIGLSIMSLVITKHHERCEIVAINSLASRYLNQCWLVIIIWLAIISCQFHKKNARYLSLTCLWKRLPSYYTHISPGPISEVYARW